MRHTSPVFQEVSGYFFSLLPSTLYLAALVTFEITSSFSLSLSLFAFLWMLCCLPLQEYIRRQLEEEQRQLEILQQQLLHEQALLLVMGKPRASWPALCSSCVCAHACVCVCVCGCPPNVPVQKRRSFKPRGPQKSHGDFIRFLTQFSESQYIQCTCCVFFLTPSICKTWTWIQPHYKFRLFWRPTVFIAEWFLRSLATC